MSEGSIDDKVLAQLLETVGGDESFVAELVETYLTDSPGLFEGMRGGLATDDRVALRRAAHTLKSTSASVGALALSTACREIETGSPEGDPAWLEGRIEAAAAEYVRAEAALRAWLAGQAGR